MGEGGGMGAGGWGGRGDLGAIMFLLGMYVPYR